MHDANIRLQLNAVTLSANNRKEAFLFGYTGKTEVLITVSVLFIL
jgi:hypothetical protein